MPTVTRGSEVGMAPATGRESMAEATANTGLTQRTRKCALSRFLSSLCGSHRFKNLQNRNDQANSSLGVSDHIQMVLLDAHIFPHGRLYYEY
ncbi:hypothetical protein X777_00422 [Ooceraea biroi]|uniref:Uncharacterized protein n=1 Tax=Ooceraea biroi TaxID=2015173 RepID=A0A026WWS1_OOCBI|nr:hypothetical protein X777_00422 [Ooceraea biroi]